MGKFEVTLCSFNIRTSLCPVALWPNTDLDVLIPESSRSHNAAQQSVESLLMSDQLVLETSTWQNTTLTRDKFPCLRRDSNTKSQQASGLRSNH